MESILQRLSVHRALARLSEQDRYIVLRLFWDEATFEEVAKELGISRRALHKRWDKIKERLKEWLERAEGLPPQIRQNWRQKGQKLGSQNGLETGII